MSHNRELIYQIINVDEIKYDDEEIDTRSKAKLKAKFPKKLTDHLYY